MARQLLKPGCHPASALSRTAAELARAGARTVEATIADMQTIRAKVGLSVQKVREMGQREASDEDLWSMVKPARASSKVLYGDNSSQYEMVGGTRLSDRKTACRIAVPLQ